MVQKLISIPSTSLTFEENLQIVRQVGIRTDRVTGSPRIAVANGTIDAILSAKRFGDETGEASATSQRRLAFDDGADTAEDDVAGTSW